MQTMNAHANQVNDETPMQMNSLTMMGQYKRFALMVGVSFAAMYVLMYAMVNVLPNVFNSINQVYMAGLMAAPMAIIEILLMSSMYPDKKKNAVILVVSLLALGFFWAGIRNQLGVGDRQFVRSMIPHHSGAILMCNEAKITDPELKGLCATIVKGQQEEVDQMKAILARLQ
jgi:hypothetical protein